MRTTFYALAAKHKAGCASRSSKGPVGVLPNHICPLVLAEWGDKPHRLAHSAAI